jgi:hypothetical protein
MATFVLVPGGWHGGWYYHPVTQALRHGGHDAYPVTLTGVGDRAHLQATAANLDAHIRDVVSVLETECITDAVLVGHSHIRSPPSCKGSGFPGAPARVRRRDLIYLSDWQGSPFTEVYERLSQDPAWHTHCLPTGHNIVAEAPDQLLKILHHGEEGAPDDQQDKTWP